jgi:acetyltransferase-like isoleucine patch superfamily enzyme
LKAQILYSKNKLMTPSQLLRALPSVIRGLWMRALILARGGECGLVFVDYGVDWRSWPHRNIKIGHKVTFGPNIKIYVPESGRLEIGDGSVLTADIFISAYASVKIGENVLIAERVSIRDADHGFAQIDVPIKLQPMQAAPIIIGSDSWIGCGVAILKGSEIGSGAVIGANAMVKAIIPDNAVAVGVPAKVIRYRDVTTPPAIRLPCPNNIPKPGLD